MRGGMTRMRLNHTVLAQRAGLGRTTVSEALSPAKPAPSPWTVEALATALNLPVEELRELQRNAAEDTGGGARAVPGRPIGEWDPHDLEVHPAGPDDAASGPGRSEARTMPGYVRREHDRVLAEVVEDAAAGRSRAVVLVGGSSTGKTRACWEAVQPRAAQGWRLWHPFAPTRAQDALEDLPRVAPRTVVWLNEAQHYLGDRAAGERIAAAVHQLLVDARRGPVLVLGTLWPEYAARYTALPVPGEPDSHSRVRELLAGRTLTVPDTFDTPALAAAAALAEGGDQLLGGALSRAGADGRVTQDLAGAPELLNRYRRATPAAAAVLEVAMDARRLGVGLHLPQAFLTDAASDYLTDTDYDYDQLTDDWAEQAFAELAALVHSKQAPLRRTSRTRLCPPASFWHAAHTHLTDPYDLGILAHEAEKRHRLQWTLSLRHRAADHGNPDALADKPNYSPGCGLRTGPRRHTYISVVSVRVEPNEADTYSEAHRRDAAVCGRCQSPCRHPDSGPSRVPLSVDCRTGRPRARQPGGRGPAGGPTELVLAGEGLDVLRGSCSCGWRGAAEYPLGWATRPTDGPLYEADVDLSGPIADYEAHLSVLRDGAVPLPAELTELLTELVRQLDVLAVKEPLVALKALADLRYVVARAGEDAAYELGARDVPLKAVASALGTSEAAARTCLNDYLHP
ncbi:helix-turn-helix domain-containing protein [Streptomyces virginiae]|uniref:helix-turn-helix domain-containing protein n=1 Tax=Streptomyces virginiae TaxID=1961 RepID=UPI0036839846